MGFILIVSHKMFIVIASTFSSEQSVILQKWPFTAGTLLECIDGQLYVCNTENISHLEEISWFDRVYMSSLVGNSIVFLYY